MTSTIKADVIQASTGTNTDLTLQGKGTGVPALASGATVGGNAIAATSQIPGANLIINSDMRIAQRGTQTSLSSTTTHYGGADRFGLYLTTLGTWTLQQTADGPDGFTTCQEAVVTTADASPAAGDTAFLVQRIEAQNLQHLKYGTANAESLTLSFWVKSDETGTGIVELYQTDNGPYQISAAYTIDVADTWEYKTVTFAGNTLGAIDNNNDTGLQLIWHLDAGSDLTGGTLNTSWASVTAANRAAGLTLALGDAISNYFRITGVKLEVGSTATDFVPDDYATALAKCRRYYFQSATLTNLQVDVDSEGTVYSATNGRPHIVVGNAMRAKPTFGLNPAYNTGSGWQIHNAASNQALTGTPSCVNNAAGFSGRFVVQGSVASGLTAGNVAEFYNVTGQDGYYYLDAEL